MGTRKVTLNIYYNDDEEPKQSVTLEGAATITVSGAEGSNTYTVRDQDHTINIRITGLGGQATTPEEGTTKGIEVQNVKETEPDPAPEDAPPVVEEPAAETTDTPVEATASASSSGGSSKSSKSS